ncbi:hypothetical protein Bca4012_083542 [Brassica carinata]
MLNITKGRELSKNAGLLSQVNGPLPIPTPWRGSTEESWINCSQKGVEDEGSFEEENEHVRPPRKNPQQPFIIEELSDTSDESDSFHPKEDVRGDKVPFITLMDEAASPERDTDLSLGRAVPVAREVFTRNVTYRGKNKSYTRASAGMEQGNVSEGTNVAAVAKDPPDCEILGEHFFLFNC